MFKFSSLRTRLIVAFLGVALVPLVLLTLIHFLLTGQVFRQNADQALFAAANQTVLRVDNFFRTGLDTVRVEAQLPGMASYLRLPAQKRAGSPEEIEVTGLLQALLKRDTINVLSYALLDLQGTTILDTSTADLHQSKTDKDFFRQPLTTGLPYASPVYLPPSSNGSPSLYFSSPVWDAVGTKVGVLAVRYNANLLQQLVGQTENLAGSQSFAILLDENHVRVAHSARPDLLFKSIVPLSPEKVKSLQAQARLPQRPIADLSSNLPQLEEVLQQSHCTSEKSCPPAYLTTTLTAPANTVVRVVATRLRSQPWFVLFVQPEQVFLGPLLDEIRLAAALTVIVAIGVVGMAIGLGRWLTRPLRHLSERVSQFTTGNLAARAQITSKDEIGRLAANFNTMAQQVGKLLQGLEDRTHDLEASQRTTAAVSELAKATLDSDRLLQEAVKLVQERFQVDFVQIYLWEEATDVLSSYASAGVISPDRLQANSHVRLDNDRSLVAIAARGRQMQSTGNLQALDETRPGRAASRFYQPVSEVAIPLLSRGSLLGVLDVQDEQGFRFSRGDLDTLSLLSSQIATALESAQLFSELQKTEERFRTIFEDAPIGMSISHLNGQIVQVNKAYCTMLHYTEAELGQKTFQELSPAEDLIEDLRQFKQLLAGTIDSYQLEKRLYRKDGQQIWVSLIITLLHDPNGRPSYRLAMIENITARKQAEESLRQSEERFRTIFEDAPIGISIASVDQGHIVQVNKSYCGMMGYTEAEAKQLTFQEITPPEDLAADLEQLQRLLAGELESYQIEKRLIRKDQTQVWVNLTVTLLYDAEGQPRYCLGMTENITDRREADAALRRSEAQYREKAEELQRALHELQQAQAQLVQSEKMSSLGQLVAGVAHEINNPINFIYANLTYANQYQADLFHLLHLYQTQYPNPAPAIQAEIEALDLAFVTEDFSRILKSMKVGADRIREIVLSLRNFSRLDEAEMKPVNIHEGIDSTLVILQSQLKEQRIRKPGVDYLRPAIAVIKDYGELPLVECYAGQLNQVFINLLTNAIDALDARAANEAIGLHFAAASTTAPLHPTIWIRTEYLAQEQISIHILDNGIGMDAATRQKLFDPFFTTKDVGEGTGLGLSIAYQIVVEQHRGRLLCHSEPGQGAEFVVEIPIRQPSIY